MSNAFGLLFSTLLSCCSHISQYHTLSTDGFLLSEPTADIFIGQETWFLFFLLQPLQQIGVGWIYAAEAALQIIQNAKKPYFGTRQDKLQKRIWVSHTNKVLLYNTESQHGLGWNGP